MRESAISVGQPVDGKSGPGEYHNYSIFLVFASAMPNVSLHDATFASCDFYNHEMTEVFLTEPTQPVLTLLPSSPLRKTIDFICHDEAVLDRFEQELSKISHIQFTRFENQIWVFPFEL